MGHLSPPALESADIPYFEIGLKRLGRYYIINPSTIVYFSDKIKLLYTVSVDEVIRLGRDLTDDSTGTAYSLWCSIHGELTTEDEYKDIEMTTDLIDRQLSALSFISNNDL
jgi:hypothetical protein